MELEDLRDVAPKLRERIVELAGKGCWLWIGSMGSSDGTVPVFWDGVGHGAPGRTMFSVRRFLWLMEHDDRTLARKEIVVNTCGNHHCVNPAHAAIRSRYHTVADRQSANERMGRRSNDHDRRTA